MKFKDRIIFLSVYNDIGWDQKQTKTVVQRNFPVLLHAPQGFPLHIGHSSDLDLKKMVRYAHSHTERWNNVAELMMINIRENRHLVFSGTSAFFRGALKVKEVEACRYMITRTQRRQSCHNAS